MTGAASVGRYEDSEQPPPCTAAPRLPPTMSSILSCCRVLAASRRMDAARRVAASTACQLPSKWFSSSTAPGRHQPSPPPPPRVAIQVIEEDNDFFFVNKPSGVVTAGEGSGASSYSFHHHVVDHASQLYKYHPNLLHRLDKGTSGLMVYAKNDEAGRHYLRLQDPIRAGGTKVLKEYLAVVHGTPRLDAGEVHGLLTPSPRHTRSKPARKRRPPSYVVHDSSAAATLDAKSGAKPIHTSFRTLASYEHPKLGPLKLLALRLWTGRKHQLRATCSYLGCPIVGDTQYGGRAFRFMLLHAHRLAFHGRYGREYDVSVAPPWADEFEPHLASSPHPCSTRTAEGARAVDTEVLK